MEKIAQTAYGIVNLFQKLCKKNRTFAWNSVQTELLTPVESLRENGDKSQSTPINLSGIMDKIMIETNKNARERHAKGGQRNESRAAGRSALNPVRSEIISLSSLYTFLSLQLTWKQKRKDVAKNGRSESFFIWSAFTGFYRVLFGSDDDFELWFLFPWNVKYLITFLFFRV